VMPWFDTAISSSWFGGPSLGPIEVGSPPGTGCVVPQLYDAIGNRSYPGVLGHNQRPRLPGVIYSDMSVSKLHRPV
jgi:hypothetical protein